MDRAKIASLGGNKREIFGSIDGNTTIIGEMTDLNRIQRLAINTYNHVGGTSH